jgi:uncharacterized membrane protein YccC
LRAALPDGTDASHRVHLGLEFLLHSTESFPPMRMETMADETDPSPIDEALTRLDAALNRLDAVVARRLESAAQPDGRDAELALMDEDRARLAAALDAASARLAEVEATTGEVGHRLDRAIETVQDVLGRP